MSNVVAQSVEMGALLEPSLAHGIFDIVEDGGEGYTEGLLGLGQADGRGMRKRAGQRREMVNKTDYRNGLIKMPAIKGYGTISFPNNVT